MIIITTNEAIAAALADVIDVGPPYFHLWDENEEVANESRLNLRDAVLKRLGELHVAPHNMAPHVKDYCPRHLREQLRLGTGRWCPLCTVERQNKE
jgi:hypothetical protein